MTEPSQQTTQQAREAAHAAVENTLRSRRERRARASEPGVTASPIASDVTARAAEDVKRATQTAVQLSEHVLESQPEIGVPAPPNAASLRAAQPSPPQHEPRNPQSPAVTWIEFGRAVQELQLAWFSLLLSTASEASTLILRLTRLPFQR